MRRLFGTRRGSFLKSYGSGAVVISNIVVTVTESYYATVTWTTNIATNTKIRWSTDTSYSNTNTNASLVTSHSIQMGIPANPLIQNQAYNFKVGNISGTALSSNQTVTSARLQLPKIGAYSAHATVFVDTLTDQTSSAVVHTSPAAPLSKKAVALNAGATITSDQSASFWDLYTWSDTLSLQGTSSLQSPGSPGADGTSVCGGYRGGNGANGPTAGGGGAAGNNCTNFHAGGEGGYWACDVLQNGGDGQGDCDDIPGNGGISFGYQYAGLNILGFELQSLPGGDGTSLFNGSGSGGGGGSGGGLLNHVGNEISNCNNGFIDASGGNSGNDEPGCGNPSPADPGQAGYAVFACRKYDGTLQVANVAQLYTVEVRGTQAGGFTFVVHTNPTETWDHLYQP